MKRSTRLSSPQRLALTPLFLAIALAAGDAGQ